MQENAGQNVKNIQKTGQCRTKIEKQGNAGQKLKNRAVQDIVVTM